MWSIIVLLFISVPICASESICEKLLPLHLHEGIRPMTTVSPFNIVTSESTLDQSQILTIEIDSLPRELKYGGFILHAHSTQFPYSILGKFTSSFDGLKLINCDGVNNTATYHASLNSKGGKRIQWQAPSDFSGEVVFKATIDQEYDKFWVGIESVPVHVVRKVAVIPSTTGILIAPTIAEVKIKSEQQNSDLIYEGCGTTKTCFGLPNECVQQNSCEAIVTAVVIDNRYQFELKSGADNVVYVALGLSTDDSMGNDSVMECIAEDGRIQAYASWNNPRPSLGNTRQGVPQNIISLLNSSYIDGTIYCKLERESLATILGNEFDLVNSNFHFLVAIGSSVTASSVTRHNLGRIASTEPVNIVEQRIDDPIYEGCGTNKTCFGFPSNCVEQKSCEAIVTAVVLRNRYQFELKSSVDNVTYVALGLSTDNRMGDDSVMECIAEGERIQAYSSWNNPRPSLGNTRAGVPQNITSLVNSSYIDGTIYCKLEREHLTTILGNEFDLLNNNFHFLVAIGSSVTASSVTRHDLGRIASIEPVNIVQKDDPIDPIYEGCGTLKTCFGSPNGCVEENSCRAIVTAIVLDGRYQFELKSGVENVAYVALGLSTDNQMGDDSVMECIPQEGSIKAYSSWNNLRTNTRQGVPQNIISLLNSSYIDGTIYCKLEREPLTIILGNEFDLLKNNFHFLVAIGSSVTASSVTRHDLGRTASTEPLTLVGIGSGYFARKISMMTVIVWFLATNCNNYLRGL